jgi:hypothetical protein
MAAERLMFDWVNDDAPTGGVRLRLAQIMDVFSTTGQFHPASVSIPKWAHEVSVSPCRGFDQEAVGGFVRGRSHVAGPVMKPGP